MGQAEVYEYLKKNGEGKANDIADFYGIRKSNIRTSIARMIRHGEVVILEEGARNPGGGRRATVYALREERV